MERYERYVRKAKELLETGSPLCARETLDEASEEMAKIKNTADRLRSEKAELARQNKRMQEALQEIRAATDYRPDDMDKRWFISSMEDIADFADDGLDN